MSLSIVHVTSVHPHDDMRIYHKMAASQAARGWEVSLVAAVTERPGQTVREEPGVALDFVADPRARRRAWRASIGAAKVVWRAAIKRPDIVQAHDPELIPFIVPLRLFGIRTIFDAHEDFVAQNGNKVWTRGAKRPLIQAYARLLRWLAARFCWMILAATDGVAAAYPAHKTRTVRNFPIDGELGSAHPDTIAERPKALAYIGSISTERGIETILEAAWRCDALEVLEIAGQFETADLERYVRVLPGWRKVRFHGYVDRDALTGLLGRVRGGLVTLYPTPNHLHAIPVKLMEYFNAGLPAIASDFPYWRSLLSDGESGIMVDPQDAGQVAEAMARFMDDAEIARLARGVVNGPRKSFSWKGEALGMNMAIEARMAS